jgi:hypothetical protein
LDESADVERSIHHLGGTFYGAGFAICFSSSWPNTLGPTSLLAEHARQSGQNQLLLLELEALAL